VEFTTRFIFAPSLFLAASPLTTVLRIVVSQPRLRRLLAFIQRHPFPVGQLPQPGEVASPDASLGKLLFESLTFQAA
jgi:hypothetical protein